MDDLFKWLFILGSSWSYVCNLVNAYDDFYFTQHPRFPENVVEGQRLVVNCQVDDATSIVYHWQLNGRNIDNTFRRYQNGSSLVFEIVHRLRDVGEYQCTAFNTSSGHSVSSSTAQLAVGWIGQDAKVAVLSPKNGGEMHEGNSLTLKCIIEGNKYHVTWYKNSVRVSLEERIQVDAVQQTLNMKALSVSDNGVYSCEVALDKASTAASATVVSTKNFALIIARANTPTIRIVPQDITVNRSGPAQFDCVYDNALRVEWFNQEDLPMRNSTGKNQNHVVYPNGTLYFRSVGANRDAGLYRCVAVVEERAEGNEAMSGGYIAYLKVAVRPELDASSILPPPTKDDKYVVRAGSTLEAYCRPKNHETVNPPPVVSWMNSNKEQISDSPFLLINQIQTNQAGQYSCRVQNGFGHPEYAISVVVTVMPVISQEPSDVQVEEDKTIRMSCGFKGSAGSLTNITWQRVTADTNGHFQRIATSSRIQISNQDASMSYLQVVRATADDDNGVYRCQVSTLGFDPVFSENATVFIRERLKFTTKPINQHLELKSKAKIHCRAHASDEVTVQWRYTNGTELPSHVRSNRNGTLVFDTVKKTDEGWYNCTASTTTKEKPISVAIKVDVGVSPKFTVRPKNHTAIIGEMVVLDCQAVGDPMPALHWDKDGEDNITELGRWKMMANGSLVVGNVKPGDRGRYGCIAGNKGGFAREEIDLDVQETPSSVTQTLTLTISCAAGYILFVVVLIVYCKRSRSKKREPESSAMTPVNTSQVTLQPNAYESQTLLPRLPSHPPSRIYSPRTTHSSHLYEKNPSGSDPASSAYSSAANSCTISRRNLVNPRKLGKGTFGEICLADTADTVFSVVMVKVLESRDEEVRRAFDVEFDMFKKLDHENVIRSIGVCQPSPMNKDKWAVYEHSKAGDLKYFVRANAKLITKAHLISFAHQIATGMEYLSKNRYTHRDLATRNCIVDLPDGLNPIVKVGNLSVTSQGANDEDYFFYRNRRIPLRWMPEEAVSEEEYSVKSDVWSYGVLLFELLTYCQVQPYEGYTDQEVLQLLTEKEPLPALMTSSLTHYEKALILACAQLSVSDRPTFSEILSQWNLS